MPNAASDPGSELEDEGIPDHLGAHPAKDATGDGQEGIFPPGDQPIAATDFGTTAAEMHEGESLDGRLARELPDPTVDAAYPTDEGMAGRIVADDEGVRADTEKDAVAYDVGAAGGGLSAEEAAMHIETP
jgi:hypothetical protein